MTTEAATEETPDAYGELLDRYRRIQNLEYAADAIGWDQQVVMPEGGTPARAQQLSTLSAVKHEHLADEALGALLDEVAGADPAGERAAVVREIRRQHDRAASVPAELVEEIAALGSEAQPVWQEARANDDWETFEPVLERMVELARERAEAIDPDRDPYEVLFERYEPYLGLDAAERVLGRLREELVDLVAAVDREGRSLAAPFEGEFDAATQEALCRDALDLLGYDWERGRLDTSAHPFTSGTQFDARITTRFDETDPVGSLTATIHEFGHATYALGLRDDAYATPLGESRDLTVHESQSRFWENHVGRTRAFWELFLPEMKERFPQVEGVTVEEAYEAVNRIYPENCIRVEADELTYHMHIVLRFEIERDLVRGDLAVSEVPRVWNERMEAYLGVRPDSDAEGCLQDIHWSQGSLGYFPTYSLGSVLAAQLHAAVEDDLGDLDGYVRDGEFAPIHDWFAENLHAHGCRYTTDDLVREATGEPYTADYFLDYATGKFTDLYGL